jgi:hypothetical protein
VSMKGRHLVVIIRYPTACVMYTEFHLIAFWLVFDFSLLGGVV